MKRLPVVGFPKYTVDTDGNVFNLKGRKLKPMLRPRGYHFYRLYTGTDLASSKLVSAHRVVAMAFLRNPKNKPQVAHRNHRKQDNRKANLKWVTDEENRKMNEGRDYAAEELFPYVPPDGEAF